MEQVEYGEERRDRVPDAARKHRDPLEPSRARRIPSRVAVVVPSYNHAPFVEACIRSVLHQTYPPTSLLVIDDGSTDGSPRVIERVLRDCPFPAELLVRGNRGLCATLNEGLARSGGDYFAYLGSDDQWHPDRLRRGVEALDARPDAVVAYSDCLIIDETGRVIGCTQDWERYVDGAILDELLRARSVPLSPTVLYRREAIVRVGWNPASRLEDYETYLQLAALGAFAYVPRPLAYWRRHGRNTSGDAAMMLKEVLGAQDRLAGHLGLDRGSLRPYQRSVRFRYAGDLLMAGDRVAATRLTLANLPGAPSGGALLRRLVRLALPGVAIRRRAALLAARATRRYADTASPAGPA